MAFNRAHGHLELCGNLPVSEAAYRQRHNVALAAGQYAERVIVLGRFVAGKVIGPVQAPLPLGIGHALPEGVARGPVGVRRGVVGEGGKGPQFRRLTGFRGLKEVCGVVRADGCGVRGLSLACR